ncbi:MAG TPA: glycoside hydrolase family 15 protein [Marmoricola sp.]|nr:glycoside hydrolase family 15 protein [Marmoricola sp.]
MPLGIEDYAIVGDLHTVALIGRNGSVDWFCLPRYDSEACFANLLGDEHGSRWLIGPAGEHTSERAYVPGTMVLETTYRTATGEVKVTDVMPTGDRRADLVRRVQGVRGTVRMRHEWVVRFDYGKVRPWVRRLTRHYETGAEKVIVATAGPDKVILAGPRLPRAADGRHEDEFDVHEGECLDFSMTWVPSYRDVPEPLDIDHRVAQTIAEQQKWADAVAYEGDKRNEVVRSLVTLRALTHEDTGGIVAAATTSLPEEFGGERNWDYRFSWLRDAALTVETMIGTNRPELARPWRNWLLRAIAGDAEDMQIMYTVDGSRQLPERELDHLAGYENSRPVRIGNGAVCQRQTDVVGEVLCALSAARHAGLRETKESWSMQRALAANLATSWQQADNGIWEIRGPQRHFTHSRVLVWAAFDRMVDGVESFGLDGPVDEWRELRDRVREEVLSKGFDTGRNSFTQHYDTTEVDASLLVLPLVGFLPGDDPRMLGTIEAIEHDLMRDGMLIRYRTESGVDGLAGEEHTFIACTFWLVSAYALAGRVADARDLMDRTIDLCNDVGLLSEEYDVGNNRMAGNFPQAYSHLTLVQAARLLALAESGQALV